MKGMTRIQMISQHQQDIFRPVQLQSHPGLPKRRLAVPRRPPGRRSPPHMSGIIHGCVVSFLGIR